jgi:hypothetical protein
MVKVIDVFGLGTGPLKDLVDRGYAARLYENWSRAEYALRRTSA